MCFSNIGKLFINIFINGYTLHFSRIYIHIKFYSVKSNELLHSLRTSLAVLHCPRFTRFPALPLFPDPPRTACFWCCFLFCRQLWMPTVQLKMKRKLHLCKGLLMANHIYNRNIDAKRAPKNETKHINLPPQYGWKSRFLKLLRIDFIATILLILFISTAVKMNTFCELFHRRHGAYKELGASVKLHAQSWIRTQNLFTW